MPRKYPCPNCGEDLTGTIARLREDLEAAEAKVQRTEQLGEVLRRLESISFYSRKARKDTTVLKLETENEADCELLYHLVMDMIEANSLA